MNKLKSLIIIFFFIGCGVVPDKASKLVSQSEFIFGTRVTVSILPVKKRNVKNDILYIFKYWKKMHQSLSPRVIGSYISKLNKTSKLDRSEITDSDFVFSILRTAFKISRITKGAFDPTLLKLSELWGFSGQKLVTKPPHHDLIMKIKKKTGWMNFYLTEKQAFLKNNIQIDLGGIAKGSAADYAVSKLKKWGYKSAIINIGGDVYLYGSKYGKKKSPWRVGISHPRLQNKQYCILSVSNESVVTSGDYERYFIYKKKRYHHLFDPLTGYPANKCISVTVTGPSCEKADAYATALFVMGPEKGIKFINKIKAYSAMILFTDKNKSRENPNNIRIKAVFSRNFKKKYKTEFPKD